MYASGKVDPAARACGRQSEIACAGIDVRAAWDHDRAIIDGASKRQRRVGHRHPILEALRRRYSCGERERIHTLQREVDITKRGILNHRDAHHLERHGARCGDRASCSRRGGQGEAIATADHITGKRDAAALELDGGGTQNDRAALGSRCQRECAGEGDVGANQKRERCARQSEAARADIARRAVARIDDRCCNPHIAA